MKDLIKEKILKGCGKPEERYGTTINCGYLLKDNKTTNLCSNCKAKLQQHEETSKAKDEEELIFLQEEIFNPLNRIKLKSVELSYARDMAKIRIEEIKQRIKENGE